MSNDPDQNAFEEHPVDEMPDEATEYEVPAEEDLVDSDALSELAALTKKPGIVADEQYADAIKQIERYAFISEFEVLPSVRWLQAMGVGLGRLGEASLIYALMPIAIFIIVICGGAWLSQGGALGRNDPGVVYLVLYFLLMLFGFVRMYKIHSAVKGLKENPMLLTCLQTGAYRDIGDYISWASLHRKLPVISFYMIRVLFAISLFSMILLIVGYVMGSATGIEAFRVFAVLSNVVFLLIVTYGFFVEMLLPSVYLLPCLKMMKHGGTRVIILLWLIFVLCFIVVTVGFYSIFLVFMLSEEFVSGASLFESMTQNPLGIIGVVLYILMMVLLLLNWVWLLVMGFTFKSTGKVIEIFAAKASRVRLDLRDAGCEWEMR